MRFLLLILISVTGLWGYEQSIANGYYINLQGDTIHAKVKLPKLIFNTLNLISIERKLKIVDGAGLKKFTPKTIKGYGFVYEGRSYNYTSKPFDSGHKFFQSLYYGKNASLYFCRIGKRKYFIVERLDGSIIKFHNGITRKQIKNKISQFFESPIYNDVISEKKIVNTNIENSLRELIEAIDKKGM